jgi:hypothetical protein
LSTRQGINSINQRKPEKEGCKEKRKGTIRKPGTQEKRKPRKGKSDEGEKKILFSKFHASLSASHQRTAGFHSPLFLPASFFSWPVAHSPS